MNLDTHRVVACAGIWSAGVCAASSKLFTMPWFLCLLSYMFFVYAAAYKPKDPHHDK